MNGFYRLAYVARARSHHQTLAHLLPPKSVDLHTVTLYGSGYFFQCFEGSQHAIHEMTDQLSTLSAEFELRILAWHHIEQVSLCNNEPRYMLSNLSMTLILQQHGLNLTDARVFDDAVQLFRVHIAVRVPSTPIFHTV